MVQLYEGSADVVGNLFITKPVGNAILEQWGVVANRQPNLPQGADSMLGKLAIAGGGAIALSDIANFKHRLQVILGHE